MSVLACPAHSACSVNVSSFLLCPNSPHCAPEFNYSVESHKMDVFRIKKMFKKWQLCSIQHNTAGRSSSWARAAASSQRKHERDRFSLDSQDGNSILALLNPALKARHQNRLLNAHRGRKPESSSSVHHWVPKAGNKGASRGGGRPPSHWTDWLQPPASTWSRGTLLASLLPWSQSNQETSTQEKIHSQLGPRQSTVKEDTQKKCTLSQCNAPFAKIGQLKEFDSINV